MALCVCALGSEYTSDSWLQQSKDLTDKGFYYIAIDRSNKSAEINPKYEYIWNGKGLALQTLGRDLDSQEANKNARISGLNDSAELVDKGEVLYLLGRYNESIESFNKSIELNPKLEDTWIDMSLALRALHRDSEADAALAKSAKLMT